MRGARALAQMWAKTGPNGVWHRLTYHLLDVAAVARLLLDRHVPRSVRRRLAARVGLGLHDFDTWCVFLAALHDFGKATPPFQVKFDVQANVLRRLGLTFPRIYTNEPHGRMTAGMETRQRLGELGWSAELAQQAARWVGGHHGVFPDDGKLDRARDHYGSGLWIEARDVLFADLTDLFQPPRNVSTDETVADVGLFVAGLTSVADWIGSMCEHFTFETGDVSSVEYFARAQRSAELALEQVGWRAWRVGDERDFYELFGFQPRPLQAALVTTVAKAQEQFFAIVEAPMGDGKTEAAFWAAHDLGRRADHRGTYFALPTMATANQMFRRTKQFLERSYEGVLSMQLLHGGAEFSDEFRDLKLRAVVDDDQARKLDEATNCGTVVAEEWFSKKKRGLLAPFSVGTIDQALLGVLRTKHGFVRLFGLSGKTVVLDEVHAYDAYTSRILDRLVAWLRPLGASVLILSATLPRARREQLCAQWHAAIPPNVPYPRITAFADNTPLSEALPPPAARTIHVDHLEGDLDGALSWLIAKIEPGGCAGLIVNTVARAQEAARLARHRWPELDVLLLHARLFARDRQARESRLLDLLGRRGDRPHRVLVIGTQVLEQSLDIDFDVLASDHAPVDLLLQRTGRLHRHDQRVRPSLLSSPTIGLIRPDEGPKFGVHELIYEKAILLRTWAVIGQRSEFTLPTDIEPLIEEVYGAAPPTSAPAHAAEIARLDAQLEEAIGELERNAETRLLADPKGCVDDPFSNFGLPLEEDNPELAKALQALTRLGEPTLPVAFLADDNVTRREPTRDETRAIVERTLSISNKSLFFELLKTRPPEAWKNSGWLRNTRVVHMQNGRARVGSKEVIDDPELGLVFAAPTTEDT